MIEDEQEQNDGIWQYEIPEQQWDYVKYVTVFSLIWN